MQLTNILMTVAILATSTNALVPRNRPHKPEKPERPSIQNIQCSSGAPYCCSPDKTKGSTCSQLKGSSISCNSVVVCCNNEGDDDSDQNCSASVQTPISWLEDLTSVGEDLNDNDNNDHNDLNRVTDDVNIGAKGKGNAKGKE